MSQASRDTLYIILVIGCVISITRAKYIHLDAEFQENNSLLGDKRHPINQHGKIQYEANIVDGPFGTEALYNLNAHMERADGLNVAKENYKLKLDVRDGPPKPFPKQSSHAWSPQNDFVGASQPQQYLSAVPYPPNQICDFQPSFQPDMLIGLMDIQYPPIDKVTPLVTPYSPIMLCE